MDVRELTYSREAELTPATFEFGQRPLYNSFKSTSMGILNVAAAHLYHTDHASSTSHHFRCGSSFSIRPVTEKLADNSLYSSSSSCFIRNLAESNKLMMISLTQILTAEEGDLQLARCRCVSAVVYALGLVP